MKTRAEEEMVSILAKLLIKDYKNTANTKVRQAYGMLCGAVGIVLNIFLFLVKFISGQISGSIEIGRASCRERVLRDV